MLAFARATEIQVAPVFFSGGAPAVAALLGGHVEAVTSTPSNYMSQYNSGDVRVLAIMAEEESALLPGVPTFRAEGYEEIGRASGRERGCQYVSISGVAVALKKKKN